MNDKPFNHGEPIAYFLTWTTYGTWLPGDERGWRRRGAGAELEPNDLYAAMAKADLKEPEFVLTKDDRSVVEGTIARHCEIRNWILHAAKARSNHVHVVVTSPGYLPETVRDQLKAWCTRNLKQTYPDRRRFWTEGASCRWINHEDDLDSAVLYATEVQSDKGKDYPIQARASE